MSESDNIKTETLAENWAHEYLSPDEYDDYSLRAVAIAAYSAGFEAASNG